MQIRVKSEPFINTPAPKLTKALLDVVYSQWWKVMRNLPSKIGIETVEIRINQALPWSTIHYYVTVNGVYETHLSGDVFDFTRKAVSGSLLDRKRNFKMLIN